MKVQSVIQIPARSGSTRLVHKNIMKIGGLPLIAYTILVAKKLHGIDRVIVNTDSAEYAEVAKKFGAEVPILRPSAIAGEKSCFGDAFGFMEKWLLEEEDVKIGKHMIMYPTSPFRNIHKLQTYVDALDRHCGVVTGFWCNLDMDNVAVHTQAGLDNIVHENCQQYGAWYKGLGHFYGDNEFAPEGSEYYAVTNPIELIDIDTAQDVMQMQTVLEHNLYDFGFDLTDSAQLLKCNGVIR